MPDKPAITAKEFISRCLMLRQYVVAPALDPEFRPQAEALMGPRALMEMEKWDKAFEEVFSMYADSIEVVIVECGPSTPELGTPKNTLN